LHQSEQGGRAELSTTNSSREIIVEGKSLPVVLHPINKAARPPFIPALYHEGRLHQNDVDRGRDQRPRATAKWLGAIRCARLGVGWFGTLLPATKAPSRHPGSAQSTWPLLRAGRAVAAPLMSPAQSRRAFDGRSRAVSQGIGLRGPALRRPAVDLEQ